MEILNEKSVIAAFKQKIGNDKIGDKGYYISSNPRDNLLDGISNWEKISEDLNEGAGNELTSKFCAVHSSSALCVNNFAPFKEKLSEFEFWECSGFSEATFEKKQPTGLRGTPPHLDFYLENTDTIIGFESKFTEYFTKKLPNHNNNLEKYFNNDILLKYLPNNFNNEIIKVYIDYKDKIYLDVAQLIKHTIGLLKNKKEKKARLVYIYWEPKNGNDLDICKKHKTEIKCFKEIIGKFVDFKALSYHEFWKMYEQNESFKEHIDKVKERYSLN